MKKTPRNITDVVILSCSQSRFMSRWNGSCVHLDLSERCFATQTNIGSSAWFYCELAFQRGQILLPSSRTFNPWIAERKFVFISLQAAAAAYRHTWLVGLHSPSWRKMGWLPRNTRSKYFWEGVHYRAPNLWGAGRLKVVWEDCVRYLPVCRCCLTVTSYVYHQYHK